MKLPFSKLNCPKVLENFVSYFLGILDVSSLGKVQNFLGVSFDITLGDFRIEFLLEDSPQ